MPAQACANGLMLSKIPPELLNLSDLECRIIALRIPFMAVFCLVRYGSQYKIRGGCTNVPASLDQVVDMLPRMSSEVQFHPMKLKKKMNYKSNYMYNYIWKDIVAAAVKWLKENNKLYDGVELNDSWADDWLNNEFSSFISCQMTNEAVAISDSVHISNSNELHMENEVDPNNATDQNSADLAELLDQAAAEANIQLTGRLTSNVLQYEKFIHVLQVKTTHLIMC